MKKIIQNKLLYPELLWERPVHYYKSQAGRIFVLAGSKKDSAAAILTCEAIFRSGTGVLTLGFPDRLTNIYKEVLPEAMRLPLPSTLSDSVAKRAEKEIIEQSKVCDVVLMGPGLSTNAETVQLAWELIFKLEKPIVLDSNAVYALIKGIEVMRGHETEEFLDEYFKKLKAPLVIVATPGEVAKIVLAAKFEGVKSSATEIQSHLEKFANLIAEKLSIIVVVKGSNSLLAEPNGTVLANNVNETKGAENSGVLSGAIASFMGQNPDAILKAIPTAIFLHDSAVASASGDEGKRVANSSILRFIPKVIKEFE